MDGEHIHELIRSYGWIVVLLGSCIENTGIPQVFIAGLVVAKTQGIPSEAMLLAAGVGSFIGDIALYALGRYWLTKERLLTWRWGRKAQPLLDAAERGMRRWGILALIFGRFIPYAGKVVPFVAGSCRLSWPRVAVTSLLGGFVLMGLYYTYGEQIYRVARGERGLIAIGTIVLLTGIVVGLWWVNRVLSKRAKAPPE